MRNTCLNAHRKQKSKIEGTDFILENIPIGGKESKGNGK